MTEFLKKLMIVEDSALPQKGSHLVLQRFREKGCEILSALNGKDALACLSGNRDCQLIILDINKPEMGGIEFLACRKFESDFRKIPVVIISSEDRRDSMERGIKLGADACLMKPFSVAELDQVIQDVTAKK